MIHAIIQARMSSKRLPRKVLLPLGDKTVLENVVERVGQAKNIDTVTVATSIEKEDDEIEKLCKKKNIRVFRGNLGDVLDRYYQCAKIKGFEHVCRVTADCPLVDPEIVDRAAKVYSKGTCDYVSTAYPVSTYPDGLDVEIFSFSALEKAWNEAMLPSEREHVTPYIWKHPELFRLYTLINDTDLSSHRWTLDEPADYEFLRAVFSQVKDLKTVHILAYLKEHPEVRSLNEHISRNEGYKNSLVADEDQKA